MSKMEVRKLGDIEDLGIIEMGRGNVISKKDILSTPGNYPVYSSSSSNNGEIGRYGKYMFDDERITWSIDGGGKLFYRNNIKYSVTNVCGWLKVLDEKKIISKYLYYLLINQWQKLNFNYSHKAHPSVIRNEYYVPNIEIKVQEEIVKILDSFTNLIDALNEELSLRQKQFEYYREKLLNSNECSKTKKLQYFAKIMNGKDYKHLGKGQIPLMGSGGIMGYVDSYLYNKKSVLLSRKGSIEKVYYIEEPFWTVDTLYWTKIDEKKIIPKFLYYILSSIHIENYALNGGIPSMTQSILYNIDVPYIDKDLQQSIVEKLDAFESLISSLKEEIVLRQKQYEYYREKLLTFD